MNHEEEIRERFTEAVEAPLRLRIIIDSQDAAECPETPFTLNVYTDDADGSESRIAWDIGNENCLIGASPAQMLRELADKIDGGVVTR